MATAITDSSGVDLKVNPDGSINTTVAPAGVSHPPIVESAIGVNSTQTPLAANGKFIGQFENILKYQQQAVNVVVRPSVIPYGDASNAKGSLFIDYDRTGTGGENSALTQIPYVVRVPGLFIPQVPITVRPWFRVRYYNDGGALAIAALGLTETTGTPTQQTLLDIEVLYYPEATKELLRTLDQTLAGSDPATVTRGVIEGVNPQGAYVHAPATGVVANNPAPTVLAANGVYTSNWYPCLGWTGGSLAIDTDVVSAVNGVDLQFSNDQSTVRGHIVSSLRADDVANGTFYEPFSPRFEFFRLVYTNGPTLQNRFFIDIILTQFGVNPPSPLPVTEADGSIGGQAGVSGTVSVPAGASVTGIAAQSGNSAASVTIPGISGTITVPGSNQAQTQFNMQPVPGTMIGPLSITFSNTAAYVVEWML